MAGMGGGSRQNVPENRPGFDVSIPLPTPFVVGRWFVGGEWSISRTDDDLFFFLALCSAPAEKQGPLPRVPTQHRESLGDFLTLKNMQELRDNARSCSRKLAKGEDTFEQLLKQP